MAIDEVSETLNMDLYDTNYECALAKTQKDVNYLIRAVALEHATHVYM